MNEACRSSSKLGRIASRRRIDRVSNGSFHDSGFSRATLCRGVLPIGEIRLINGEVGCNTNEVRYSIAEMLAGIGYRKVSKSDRIAFLHTTRRYRLPAFRFLPSLPPPLPLHSFPYPRSKKGERPPRRSSKIFQTDHPTWFLGWIVMSNDADRNDRPSESEAAAS